MIHVEFRDFGCYEIIDEESGETIYFQSDWDRPMIASLFGWKPCPFCNETDGTVNCKHRTASAMIHSATNFLDKNADYIVNSHASLENGIICQ